MVYLLNMKILYILFFVETTLSAMLTTFHLVSEPVANPCYTINKSSYSIAGGYNVTDCNATCAKTYHYQYGATNEEKYCFCYESLDPNDPNITTAAMTGGGCTSGEYLITRANIDQFNPSLNLQAAVLPNPDGTPHVTGQIVELGINATYQLNGVWMETPNLWVNWGDRDYFYPSSNLCNHTYVVPGKFDVTVAVSEKDFITIKLVVLGPTPSTDDSTCLSSYAEVGESISCYIPLGDDPLSPGVTLKKTFHQAEKNTTSTIVLPESSYYIYNKLETPWTQGDSESGYMKTTNARFPERFKENGILRAFYGKLATTTNPITAQIARENCLDSYCIIIDKCQAECPVSINNKNGIFSPTYQCLDSFDVEVEACFGQITELQPSMYDKAYITRSESFTPTTTVSGFHMITPMQVTTGYHLVLNDEMGTMGFEYINVNDIDQSDYKYDDVDGQTRFGKRFLLEGLVEVHPFYYLKSYVNITCTEATPIPNSLMTPINSTDRLEALRAEYSSHVSFEFTNSYHNSTSSEMLPAVCVEPIQTISIKAPVYIAMVPSPQIEITITGGSGVFLHANVVDQESEYFSYQDFTNGEYLWNLTVDFQTPGKIPFVVTAKNLIGNTSESTILNVIPPLTQEWTATPQCLCLNVPEGHDILLTLPEMKNPPWNASFIVRTDEFGFVTEKDSKTVEFETRELDGPHALRYLSRLTFENPGIYTLYFSLENEVEFTAFNTSITIHQRIDVIDMKITFTMFDGSKLLGFGEENDFFLLDSILDFEFLANDGKAYTEKWRLEVDGKMYDNVVPLFYNVTGFNETREYKITVSCYNEVQKWISLSKNITIFDQIDGLEIDDDNLLLSVNDTKILDVKILVIPQTLRVCFVVNWGDGTSADIYGDPACILDNEGIYAGYVRNEFQISHQYMKSGIFEVHILATDDNIVLKHYTSVTIFDGSIPCDSMGVSIIDKSVSPYQSKVFISEYAFGIMAIIKIDCNVTHPTRAFWRLQREEGIPSLAVEDIQLEGVIASFDKPALTFPPKFLKDGRYRATFNFIMDVSEEKQVAREAYTYFVIKKSPLVATMLKGMSKISRLFGDQIDLSLLPDSLDPSLDRPLTNKDFQVVWFCRKILKEPAIPEEIDLDAESFIDMENQTIPAANSSLSLTGGGCFGVGPGSIESGNDLSFSTSSFCSKTGEFEITALMLRDTRRESTSIIVELQGGILIPYVSIECLNGLLCFSKNGKIFYNSNNRLLFTANCSKNCFNDVDMTYEWEIFEDKDYTPLTTCYRDIDPDCEYVYTEVSDRDIIISDIILKQRSDLDQLVLKVNLRNMVGGNGYSEVTIYKNTPPEGGICEFQGGNATVEIFLALEVKCKDWVDPEKAGIRGYTLYYYVTENDVVIRKVIASGISSSYEVMLPIGTFALFVDIADVWGASTTIILSNITIVTPDEIAPYEEIINDLKESFALRDSNIISMKIGAISSMRDVLQPSGNITDPLEDTEQYQALLNVNEINVEMLSAIKNTLPLDSIENIDMVSSLLSDISKGATEDLGKALTFDKKMKEEIFEIMDLVTDKMDKVDVAAPEELHSVFTSILDTSLEIIGVTNTMIAKNLVSPGDYETAGDLEYSTDIGDDINFKLVSDEKTMKINNVRDIMKKDSVPDALRLMETLVKVENRVGELLGCSEDFKVNSPLGAFISVTKPRFINFNEDTSIPIDSKFKASIIIPKDFNIANKYNPLKTPCPLFYVAKVLPEVVDTSHDSFRYVSENSKLVSLEFKTNEMIENVNNSDGFIFIIPRKSKIEAETVFITGIDYVNKANNIIYHKFMLPTMSQAFVIELTPEDNFPKDTGMLIKGGYLPTLSKYDYEIVIDSLPEENKTYKYFNNNITDLVNKSNIVYIGILRRSDGDNTKNNDLSFNYTIRAYTSGCYFYMPDNNGAWSNKGTQVIEANLTATKCKSFHLTEFVAGHLPASIDIDFEFIKANMAYIDNTALFTTIIIVVVTFIILLIWARIKDKFDALRVGAIPLPDNNINDKYIYEITFHTGPSSDAATESNVYFILTGDLGASTVRELPKNNPKLFNRYCSDCFAMTTPVPLGNIRYIRVFHDNSGFPPYDNWELGFIVIRDLQKRRKYVFNTDCWLSFNDKGDNIDRQFDIIDYSKDLIFGRRFYYNINMAANKEHPLLSIFMKPYESRFLRCERVLVLFVYFCVAMALNAAYYKYFEVSKPFSVFLESKPLLVTTTELIIAILCSAVALIPQCLLTYIFNRVKPRHLSKCRAVKSVNEQLYEIKNQEVSGSFLENDSKKTKDTTNIYRFPWIFRYVTWVFAFILIIGSISIVILFGITWTESLTQRWLSSFIISFVFTILILHTGMIILVAFLRSLIKIDLSARDVDCDEMEPKLLSDEEYEEVNGDKTNVTDLEKIVGVDVDDIEVETLNKTLIDNKLMSIIIKDITKYVVFVIILIIMVSGHTNSNSLLLKNTITNSFIHQVKFEKISNSDNVWHWIKNGILPSIRAQANYDLNETPPYGLRGFIGDYTNRLIGHGILRQIRANEIYCIVDKDMETLVPEGCTGDAGSMEDKKNYCDGWQYSVHCDMPEFKYRTQEELQTFDTEGKLATYSGGGYIVRLNELDSELQKKFTLLQEHQWLNNHTRALLLEFSVYNANVNLFCICKIMIEFVPGGGVVKSWKFNPQPLLKLYDAYGLFIVASEVAFLVLTILVTINQLWKLKKEKLSYFTKKWNLADVCILIASYSAVALYFYKEIYLQEALLEFDKTKGNGYIRLDYVATLGEYFMNIIAFVTFFSVIKFIKFLQFNILFKALSHTIAYCWKDLQSFYIVFLLVFINFSWLFYLLFAHQLAEFASKLSAVETCFKMMLGKFNFDEMYQANKLSPAIFFMFALMNSFILVNVMLSIILEGFALVKEELAKLGNDHELLDYLNAEVKYNLRMKKRQLNKVEIIKSSYDTENYEENLEDVLTRLESKMNVFNAERRLSIIPKPN